MSRSAPAIHAAYGEPHALAWNIGTIGRRRSFQVYGTPEPVWMAMVCMNVERCE